MGLPKAIGKVSHEPERAHPMSSATFLMTKNGPIREYRHISYEQEWAHPMSLATFFMNKNGPTQGYRQSFS